MTPAALNRPTTCPSNTHMSSPSTSSTRGTRSRTSAGARLVNRSAGSDQWESASTMNMSANASGITAADGAVSDALSEAVSPVACK